MISVTKNWNRFEISYLTEFVQNRYNLKQIHEYFHYRTIESIRKKINRLGLQLKLSGSQWNDNDNQLLDKGIQEDLNVEEIVVLYLPHRSINGVKYQLKTQKWKVNKWTFQELFLLDLGLDNNLSLKQIQKQSLPNRTLKALKARLMIPNWNALLYDWNLPFDRNDTGLAFLAGFILADGHIYSNHIIEIAIHKKDVHLLTYFCDILSLEYSKIKNHSNNTTVSLCLPASISRLFIKYFKLSKNKSKGKVVFPSFLKENALKAFLIGLYYGDGSCNQKIFKNKNKNPAVQLNFLSSFNFLVQLLQYAQQNNFFLHFDKTNIKKKPTSSSNFDLASIFFSGCEAIEFLRFLLQPLPHLPRLERKIKNLLICPLPRKMCYWSKQEDQKLKQLLKTHPEWTFKQIAKHFNNRTPGAIYYRATTFHKKYLKIKKA